MSSSNANPLERMLRLGRRAPRGLTVVAWFGGVLAIFHLAALDGGGFRTNGYVESRSYQVAPLTLGRIESLCAQLHQDVQPGDVVARLSSAETAFALRAAQFELTRLEAERARTAAVLVTDAATRAAEHRAEERRFSSDRDEAHLDLLRTQSLLNEDDSRLQRLDLELDRLRKLGPELVAPDELEEKRLQREGLAIRVQGHRVLLAEQRSLFESARTRADEFARSTSPVPDPAVDLAPLDEAIAAQTARIEQLRVAEAELVLRAPVAGRVAAILRRPGEVVGPGECVLTLVEHEPSAVVAHLPETLMSRVGIGTEAVLYRHGNRAEAYEAVVVQTGTAIEQMPLRTDAGSVVPRWGFPVHLSCPTGRGILAGEQFSVVFRGSPPVLAAPSQ